MTGMGGMADLACSECQWQLRPRTRLSRLDRQPSQPLLGPCEPVKVPEPVCNIIIVLDAFQDGQSAKWPVRTSGR